MQGIFSVDDKTECKVILVQFFLFGICLLKKIVKVSFQCVALLMLHPLEFIDINYMKLFEFPHPQFSLYNFHL